MKADIDRLLEERGFAALLVSGPSVNNPAMYYLSNGVAVGELTRLLKKPGEAATLIVNPFERDEARKSGLRVVENTRYNPLGILNEEHGDRLTATARVLEAIFADFGVRGKVALFGQEDQGRTLALASTFNSRDNGVQLVGEFADSILDVAQSTKDAAEIARIRSVGERTVAVVAKTAAFLRGHRAEGGVLVRADGGALTIGDVKREIRRWLSEANLEDPHGVIFAIGHDAGVPHSAGEAGDPIALGKAIVYDIFPREAGSGYFYDFTRTWCVGYAPPEVQRVHQDVRKAYEKAVAALRVGELTRVPQQQVLSFFASLGHPTVRSDPKSNKGYVHSLGHGVGLSVHESPQLSDFEGNTQALLPGCVVTIEPGLYYPDDGGFGIRIEDCYWLNPESGRAELLVEYPPDLVLSIAL